MNDVEKICLNGLRFRREVRRSHQDRLFMLAPIRNDELIVHQARDCIALVDRDVWAFLIDQLGCSPRLCIVPLVEVGDRTPALEAA